MSNYVNDALLDASPYKKQADEAKSLVNKWDKTGLLDGLNEEFQRSSMATLLENQAKQLINEFHNASCFVLPSLFEPWGLVVNEALSSGLPVIATNHGAFKDYIFHQYKGWLCSPENIFHEW